MNPDPYAPIDPDTPLRFDHLLHLLTSFAVCLGRAIAAVTGCRSVSWRLQSPETYERLSPPLPGGCAGDYGHIISWERLCETLRPVCFRASHPPDNEGRQVTRRAGLIRSCWESRSPHLSASDGAGKDGTDRRRLGARGSRDSRRRRRTLGAVGGRRPRHASDRTGHAGTAVDGRPRHSPDSSRDHPSHARAMRERRPPGRCR